MKKLFSILMSSALLLSAFASFTASAAEYSPKETPDLFITETSNDQTDNGKVAKYAINAGQDPFEFIEIVNLSGKELNLYDYCITYNGSAPTSPNFENQITEITPIKGGDWRDGSTQTKPTDPQPLNPDTFIIKPGEVVVLWSMYHQALSNDMDMDDFRTFWGIPADSRVLYWDGNSDVNQGGDAKNFNMKNSGTGTYGIAKTSEVIEESITGYTDVISWATCDYDAWAIKTTANETFEFILDKAGDNLKRALWVGEVTPEGKNTVGTLSAKQIENFGDLIKTAAPEITAPVTDAPGTPDTTAKPATTGGGSAQTSDPAIILGGVSIAMAAASALALKRKKK